MPKAFVGQIEHRGGHNAVTSRARAFGQLGQPRLAASFDFLLFCFLLSRASGAAGACCPGLLIRPTCLTRND